jgi:hypothetical protein
MPPKVGFVRWLVSARLDSGQVKPGCPVSIRQSKVRKEQDLNRPTTGRILNGVRLSYFLLNVIAVQRLKPRQILIKTQNVQIPEHQQIGEAIRRGDHSSGVEQG